MSWFSSRPVVTVLRLQGIIGQIAPLRRGLTLRTFAGAIERAFQPRRLEAVALAINSPGGSPVQSALIADRIRKNAQKKNLPVIAFIEDVAASGGYWLACAGDQIYADENSIVGSIGVISASFGFQDLLKRHGVERRVHTSGEHKSALDPFLPETPHDVRRLESIQAEVHESFKALVRARRGKRLKAPEDQLFNGDFGTGRRALDFGLIDGIGDLRTVLTDRFGTRIKIVPVGAPVGWLRRRLGIAAEGQAAPASWGGDLAGHLVAALEERTLWSRFGL